jgi:transcriptional regulator with XRE-family HTH domain
METELSRRLKASRIEKGYSEPKDIAPMVGRSVRQIYYYEAGHEPPLSVIRRWARVTGKPMTYFLPDDDAGEDGPTETVAVQVHPGIEALVTDPDEVSRHNITEAQIEELRSLRLPRPVRKIETARIILVALQLEPPS